MENEEENVDVEVQKSTGSIENEENEKAKIEIPQKRKRQGVKTSSVWDHFTMVKKIMKVKGKEVEKERAECNYCQADYAADTKNCGTSTLWSHINHKCRKCPFSSFVDKSTKQAIITDHFTKTNEDSEVNSSGTRTSRFSQATVRELIGKYFIIDELPFRHIEGEEKIERSSPARLKRFREACTDANVESKALLCLDVVTRWNSTYMMLEAALKFKSVFKYMEGDAYYIKYFEEERVNGEKLDGPPEASDWSNAEVFVNFLKSFYELTLKFSGSLYVTSNLFFQEILQVRVELNDMKASKDELISKMAASMQLKFNKYWGNIEKVNLLQYIASILDPRFKLDVVRNGFRKEKLLENVDFDILDWWKRNSSKYPIVSRIARDVLAVQMSSVA
uniref:BED-type domain-containing protein n=1 Tax=Cannabis sativa TaxID=3483 RepID=A0A803QGS4_CANSA